MKKYQKQYIIKYSKLNSSIVFIIIFIFVQIIECQSKINNQIFQPNTYLNQQIPIKRLQSSGHRFSIQSTDQNYELNGQVYQTHQILNQNDIYNISKYKKSQSCTYFKSLIQMQSIQGHILDYVAIQSIISQKYQLLYVIGMNDNLLIPNNNKKFLNVYKYNSTNIKFITQVSFINTQLNSGIQADLFMANFNDVILFSDGNYLYQLNLFVWNDGNDTINSQYDWVNISNFNTQLNYWGSQQFLGFTTKIYQDKQLLLLLYTEKIIFYQYYTSIHRVNIFISINKQGNDVFQDVQVGTNNFHLYALARNKLLFYRPQNLSNPLINQLAGQLCNKLYIFHSTIQIICQYQKKNFVGQYFYDFTNNTLILNRFYNDIQNYRLINYIKNYLFMVGQNDIIITSNGVNRKILLNMPKSSYSQKFVSFGIQNIHLLNQLKTFINNTQIIDKNQTLFAIGQDFIVFLKLKFVPAQIWCYIHKHPVSSKINILMVRNTSICQMNDKKSTLKSICINAKPIQITFQKYQLEEKSTSILLIILLLLVCVLVFFCLGCVFRQNMNLNDMMGQIKKKVDKIKHKEKNHQLKKI